jgi:hypothetical protein
MKKLVLAAAFVLTATSASFAQYAYEPGYGYYAPVPGYYPAPSYGYSDYSTPAWSNDTNRGGPGPRVGAGGGMGIGAQR